MTSEVYKDVPLDWLHLDPENPRLPMGADWFSESEKNLLKEFYRRYNLIELARSIADKGFTPRHAEALLVIPDFSRTNGKEPSNTDTEESSKTESDGPKGSDEEGTSEVSSYIVVEGNRRLATLKLLTSAENRRAAEIRSSEWDELAEKSSSMDLGSIPVIVYQNREQIADYLGYRHITGPSPWRPEAKARFIAKLLGEGSLIGEVARRIGSNHRTVRRYAEAHAIFVQAHEAGIPTNGIEARFGVFYNALDWEGIREYLDLGRQIDINELPNFPVSSERLDHLRNLVGLLTGDSSRNLERAVRDSRDLTKLSQVLRNEVATANLLRERDLERAWRISGGGKAELLGILADLYLRLAEVNGQATEYGGDSDIRRQVRRVRDLVTDMAGRYKVDSP